MEIENFDDLTPPQQALFRAKLQLAGFHWLGPIDKELPDHIAGLQNETRIWVDMLLRSNPGDSAVELIMNQQCHPVIFQHNNRLYFN